MYKRFQQIRKSDNGFTLTEMLIVIVILGVLSGIVVFAVSAFNNDGVTASCKADVKTVEIASEAYYAKTTKYATAIDDEKHTPTTLVGAGYLKEAPSSTKYTVSYIAATGAVSSPSC